MPSPRSVRAISIQIEIIEATPARAGLIPAPKLARKQTTPSAMAMVTFAPLMATPRYVASVPRIENRVRVQPRDSFGEVARTRSDIRTPIASARPSLPSLVTSRAMTVRNAREMRPSFQLKALRSQLLRTSRRTAVTVVDGGMWNLPDSRRQTRLLPGSRP